MKFVNVGLWESTWLNNVIVTAMFIFLLVFIAFDVANVREDSVRTTFYASIGALAFVAFLYSTLASKKSDNTKNPPLLAFNGLGATFGHFVIAFSAGAALYALALGFRIISGIETIQLHALNGNFATDFFSALLFSFYGIIIAPFIEEFLFRSFLTATIANWLRQTWGHYIALFLLTGTITAFTLTAWTKFDFTLVAIISFVSAALPIAATALNKGFENAVKMKFGFILVAAFSALITSALFALFHFHAYEGNVTYLWAAFFFASAAQLLNHFFRSTGPGTGMHVFANLMAILLPALGLVIK